ncbi:response regulator [Botrimarina mediterranea]|uniref:response regulator n=1 Tax=Botrimarina mediterranea TaxID=2528022 RepID=UPI00119D23EF|nr:response regulator [Botrimarina mediterranea]
MSNRRADEHANGAGGLLSAVLASCRDAIIACSSDGVVEEWNRGAEEVFGISRDSALGESITRFIPADRRDEIDRLVNESMAGRAVAHYETQRLRSGGESFPAAVCGFPLRDAAGQVTGFATIERDLTDRVRGAQALREALAAAESASQTKSRFLANVSHELRTPMNAIMGMTSLALEEQMQPELRDCLETIRDSADTMVNLINDVLDLSRFECDEFELEEVEFEFRDTIETASKVLGAAAHAKGIELVCRIAPDTPELVIGDPARMRQVLTNLIGNAVKFTSQGHVLVEVSPLVTESTRCRMRLSVSDTGIGINEKDQVRIFAPFTQVDGSSIRNYGGSGLGLAITRHLVDCFGSKLQVESEFGRGSHFWFDITLPIPEKKQAKSEHVADQLSGLSALVVDDNTASRSALAEQLGAWGMNADTVDSGDEALRKLRRSADAGNPYDLAIIDAQMPGMDGFSVVSHIEGERTIKTKPILMSSTIDRLEFSRRCAEAGATAFVSKPISQSQLFNAVTQATGAAALEGESRLGLYDRPHAAPRRVLLVEDTPANRKVVQRVLQRRGHEVIVAVNGSEAIEAFKSGVYDLVLMDVQMPIMDGLQATEAIRDLEREESRQPTRILAMTAHNLRGDRERCRRAGMNGYLAKPLDLAELLDLVESEEDSPRMEPNPTQPLNARTQGEMSALDNPSPTPAADLPTALARLRDDKGLLCDMIGFFLEDSPRLRETLRESHQAGDYATLHRTAHSLKGLAANFDAHAAIEAARDLEDAAKNEEADAIPALLDRVDNTCDELVPFLENYRKQSK